MRIEEQKTGVSIAMPGVSAVSILNNVLPKKPLTAKVEPKSAKAVKNTILAYLQEGHLRKAVSLLFSSSFSFSSSLYSRLFQLCSSNCAIVEARKVESHLVSFSPSPETFLLNRAIETYGLCRCLEDARKLFDEMPHRNGGSWNAMITAYTQNRYAENAIQLFLNMNKSVFRPNEITYASVLGSCANVLALQLSRQIHGQIVKFGFVGNVILASSLVDIYGKCWFMTDSRRMFDEIPNPNDVSWNVIVRRYHEMGDNEEAINMFFQMFRKSAQPLNFTFSNALIACSTISALKEGMQTHGVAIKIGFEEDEVVSSSLINMYVKCGRLENAVQVFDNPKARNLIASTSMVFSYGMSGQNQKARELFDQMPERNVISWNAMLAGYIRAFEWEEALSFLLLMQKNGECDQITLTLILKLCAAISNVEMGKQVHGFVYRCGVFANLNICNALLDMYGKCGHLRNARTWFYQISQWRDKISWNALLTSYTRHGMSEQAMNIFGNMQWEARPNKFTCATLLAACANTFMIETGKQVHCFMIRNNYEIDIVVRGALVDMYSKCRCIYYAMKVFKEGASRDLILWNSIILGCYHNQRAGEVVELFKLMKDDDIKPDHVTFQGVLLACVSERLIELGGQVFDSMANEFSVIPRLEHYESMIELYGRHGCLLELENFVKNIPFELTISMLEKVLNVSRKHEFLKLGNWASAQLLERQKPFPNC